MKPRYWILLSLCSLLGACTPNEPALTPTPVQELEKQLTALAADSLVPGFSVAVVGPDTVLYQQGFGYANVAARTPFTPATVQPIGSVSKTLIGMALLQLVEQGQLSLDTDINDVLPFRVVNPHRPAGVIRIRHLVTHTAGILDREAAYEEAYAPTKRPPTSLGAYLAAYFTAGGRLYQPDNFSPSEPGARYAYTNLGAALAAYLVEVKTGESYATYTQRTLLAPLGLPDAHWWYDDARAGQYATLYDAQRQPHPLYSLVTYPDGGLRASGRDLARYLRAMLRGHAGRGGVLTPASFDTLFRPRFHAGALPTHLPEKEPNIGLFWAVNRHGRLGHTGSDPGTAAFVSFDPQRHLGRVLLLNSDIETAAQQAHVARLIAALQHFEDQQKP